MDNNIASAIAICQGANNLAYRDVILEALREKQARDKLPDHAHWIKRFDAISHDLGLGDPWYYICSACGKGSRMESAYCPHCGKGMEDEGRCECQPVPTQN